MKIILGILTVICLCLTALEATAQQSKSINSGPFTTMTYFDLAPNFSGSLNDLPSLATTDAEPVQELMTILNEYGQPGLNTSEELSDLLQVTQENHEYWSNLLEGMSNAPIERHRYILNIKMNIESRL